MHTKSSLLLAPALLALSLQSGCMLFQGKPAEPAPVGEGETFTPIRTKYKVVTSADLPVTEDALQIAVVDIVFEGSEAKLGFLPAKYRPRTGFCQLTQAKKEAKTIAELVQTIDFYVDRMPFAILFTCNGRATSDPDVAETLPLAYEDFFADFQAAMKAEDIDFVCLLPEKVTFLK